MFKMMIKKFNYQMSVNERQWISGLNTEIINISEKGEAVLDIPVSLNLIEMGQSVMQLLQGDSSFNYQFSGDIDFGETIDLLKSFNLPFNKSGQLKLLK